MWLCICYNQGPKNDIKGDIDDGVPDVDFEVILMKDGSAEKSTHLNLDGSSLCWRLYATNQTILQESILAIFPRDIFCLVFLQ